MPKLGIKRHQNIGRNDANKLDSERWGWNLAPQSEGRVRDKRDIIIILSYELRSRRK